MARNGILKYRNDNSHHLRPPTCEIANDVWHSLSSHRSIAFRFTPLFLWPLPRHTPIQPVLSLPRVTSDTRVESNEDEPAFACQAYEA